LENHLQEKVMPSVTPPLLELLKEKGVRIPSPESVEIGSEVDPGRISGDRVTIHSGCRLFGPKTLILPGVELGYEGPATVHNCQMGRGVELRGGFFSESCFLAGASMGLGAQVREACLLEEGARGAHTVGLKQTILFPFVTLGSLINFCDCFMAGGTDEKNHSEVGSSYIHFNYTPNQDKATPSMIGDVPRGVLLNQPPIFLGGQGGLVGPVRVGYGTVVAAGTILRKDLLNENTILLGSPSISRSLPFHPGLYRGIKRLIQVNTLFIANLIALRRWYLDVRFRFSEENSMDRALHEGAVDKLEKAISERIKRLGDVAARMPRSIELYRETGTEEGSGRAVPGQVEFFKKWPEMKDILEKSMDREGDPLSRESLLRGIEKGISLRGWNYLNVIRGLGADERSDAVSWLQGLIDQISREVMEV
jgi:bifunctional UDP-N-acetylglucosamine pyrophosphorylase / glucosamine-1-phosphate N-acetyltransferase